MKIIFLDFDGVVSTFEKGWNIDKEKIILIENIISSTNAKLVISSSWAIGCKNADDFRKKLRFDKITNTNSQESLFIDSIYDVTDHMGSCRGDEIKRWLEKCNVESYVIIDDDDDMLEEQLFNFVQTDTFEGITSREVKLCVQILNKEKVVNPIRLNYNLRYKWLLYCNGFESNINDLLHKYYE